MLDETARYKMMANKLMIEFSAGRLSDSEFAESFVPRVHEKLKLGKTLTDKEIIKLEELFDQF
jgi:hypothetical protein